MLKALLTLSVLWVSVAQADFTVPALTGPVVDEAGMISSSTSRTLENYLRNLNASGGTQLQVVTLKSLAGLSIEEAGIKIAEQWKIGTAKQDNGVILIFAPNERRVRIEVGQGREGDLPDVTASRIIREIIIPRMRAGQADRAVTDGVLAIVHYTDPKLAGQGEQTPVDDEPPRVRRLGLVQIILLLLFFGIFALPAIFRGGRGGGLGGGGFGGFGGGGFGGGGFGGGFSGGGGGWSGGGGGFSGGGSSGSW